MDSIQEAAQQALNVQDACNLSGVVRTWAKVMDILWNEAHNTNKGTGWINKHPINTMFLDKLADLNGRVDPYIRGGAYDQCKALSEGVIKPA